MLPKSQRISKRDFSFVFRKADGKVFSKNLTMMYKKNTSFKLAPVFPKKLKLTSVTMHYERRVLYSIMNNLIHEKNISEIELPTFILCMPNPSYLQLSFEEKKLEIFELLKKIASLCKQQKKPILPTDNSEQTT